MDIASRLKNARILRGKTQKQVSEETGINNKTLSGYERGVSEPDLSTLNLLSKYYRVTLDYLLENTENPEPAELQQKPLSLAAHFEGEMTEEEEQQIRDFAQYLLNKKEDKND